MTFLKDVRYAFRTLLASPVFAAIAVLSLALGIGANTTIYRVIDELLLHDVTAFHPERLLRVGAFGISYPNYRDLARSGVFKSLALYGLANWNLRETSSTERVFVMITSPNFFETLGVSPALGRRYSDADANAFPVLISDGLWHRALGGDANILGRVLDLNDHRFTVIGVLPPDYRSAMGLAIAPEVYVPANAAILPGIDARDQLMFGKLIGRMPDGASRAQVRTALEVQQRRLQRDFPAISKDLDDITHIEAIGGIQRMFDDPIDGRNFLTFYSLLALVVTLVLMIACANVSGLLIARGASRQREIAVRAALGASRSRLIAQFLAEGFLLAFCGAALGLLMNFWLTHLLSQVRVPMATPFEFSFAPDTRLLLYSLAVTVLAIPLCALFPALRASQTDLVASMKLASAAFGRMNARNALVAAQVALSFVLMAAALLFGRAIVTLAAVHPGFDLDHTIFADVAPAKDADAMGGVSDAYRRRMEDRVRSIPGVAAVSGAAFAPLNPETPVMQVRAEGAPVSDTHPVNAYFIGPDYFKTLDIRLGGREFNLQDETRKPAPAIANQTLARQFFAGDAIGKRVIFTARNGREQQLEIVGVAADSKVRTLGENPQPLIYLAGFSSPRLLVRVDGNPEAFVGSVRRALHDLDPGAGVIVETLRDNLSIATWPTRVGAQLLAALSALGLILALVGLYGVIAFTVARRTPEIGIRMALGASRANVLRLVLRDAVRVIAIGIAIGIAVAFFAMQPLGRILPISLSTRDPLTFAAAASIVLAAGIAAVLSPARRAAKIDPAIALKYE